jgi:Na+-transporting methylmalonyl-CoA/oxaloacetate decarboxylase gamma subunit
MGRSRSSGGAGTGGFRCNILHVIIALILLLFGVVLFGVVTIKSDTSKQPTKEQPKIHHIVKKQHPLQPVVTAAVAIQSNKPQMIE